MGPRPFGRGRLIPLWFICLIIIKLQWGRDLSVAEGILSYLLESTFLVLQWGRDLSVAEGWSHRDYPQPYWALQWGRDLSVAEGTARREYYVVANLLQWGRDLSVAEGEYHGKGIVAMENASMGPRPFGRGRRP